MSEAFVTAEALPTDGPLTPGTGEPTLLVIWRTTGVPVSVECMAGGRFSSRDRAERHAEQVADEINASAAAYRSSGPAPPT